MNHRIQSDTAPQKQHANSIVLFILLTTIALGFVAARKLLHSDEPCVNAHTTVGKALRQQIGFQTDRLPRVDAQIRFYIGEHDGIEHPFDHNMYRAYFFWLLARRGRSTHRVLLG